MNLIFRLLPWLLPAALLGGCGAPPPAAAPGTVRIRWAHDPESLDPLVQPNQYATEATNLLYQSLLQIDYQAQQPAPALAETLPTTRPEGDSVLLVTYRLRPAARWDDGRPVLAADVAFTLRLLHCPTLPTEGARAQFGFIRALLPDPAHPADPCRFVLRCRGQAPEFALATGDFPILSEHALDPGHTLRRWPLAALADRPGTAPPDSALARVGRRYLAAVLANKLPGTGPYRLTQWQKDHRLTFERKARWWADSLRPRPAVLLARPHRLHYLVLPDDAAAALALRRHALDVYPQVPAPLFARLQAAGPAARLAAATAPSYDVLTAGFNTRRPALADAATRRALARLFDADGLRRATQAGLGLATVGLVSPVSRAFYNDSLRPVPFAPAEAAALLRRAGWQRPSAAAPWQRPATRANQPAQKLTLTLRYRAGETLFETTALQFRAAAQTLGIGVTLLPTEAGALTEALHRGDFDVYVRTLKGNPFVFNYAPILHSRAVGEGNFTGFGTPASDRLIEAVAAAGPATKAPLLRQFQALLQAEAPLVPLFFLPTRLVADRRLRGLAVSGVRPGYAATALYWPAAPAP